MEDKFEDQGADDKQRNLLERYGLRKDSNYGTTKLDIHPERDDGDVEIEDEGDQQVQGEETHKMHKPVPGVLSFSSPIALHIQQKAAVDH